MKFQHCNSEAVFLEVQTVVLNENKKRNCSDAIYRPTNSSINKFQGLLIILEHVILQGDFNINLLNEEIEHHIDDLTSMLSSNNSIL